MFTIHCSNEHKKEQWVNFHLYANMNSQVPLCDITYISTKEIKS